MQLRFFQNSTEFPALGVALLGFSLTYFVLVFWRFEWMRRKVPAFVRWGRLAWGFPASRRGALIASLLGVILGLLSIDSYFGIIPKVFWTIATAFMVTLTGAAA